MTILFLSRLFHPHIGGVETHVLELSKQLIKKGHKVIVITEGFEEGLKDKQTFQGIDIYRIPLWDIREKSKKFVIWEWLFAHQKLLKRASLIHVHDVIYWLYPIFWINKNKYITFHGYEGSKPPTKSAILQRKIGEVMVKRTINIGSFMKRWYQAKPDVVLYGATSTIPANKKTKQAIYIGRLHEDTGIMMYLSALLLLRKKNFHLKLDVYGDGPQMRQAQEYVKKFQLPVTFFGFKKDASKHISSYRFAFVSRYLTVLEAMSVKVPVFAVYNNEIKSDYLTCHPQSENMIISGTANKLAISLIKWQKPNKEQQLKVLRAHQWAKDQTWNALAKAYLSLWG